VLRVLNRQESNKDVVARVAGVLESNGFRVPRHLQAAIAERSPDADEPSADAGPLPVRDVGHRPPASITGEVVSTTPAVAGSDIERAESTDNLVQAMLQAAEGGRSGLPSSLRYQSLEIRPLAERMTVVDQMLEQLVEDVHAAKDELRRGRTERIEDMALLVDLISASWRTMDQRLNRIERKLDESLHPNGAHPPASTNERATGDESG